MESKPGKSQESSPDLERRKFLGTLGAGALVALGVRPNKAEAVSVTQAMLGYDLLGFGQTETADEKKRIKIINEIKVQNTTAQFEKDLVNILSDEDIASINNSPDQVAKILRDAERGHWEEKSGIAATAIVAGAEIGAVVGHKMSTPGNEKEDTTVGAAIGASIAAMMAAAGILGSEPTLRDGEAAEENLFKWIKEEILLVGSISRETLNERVEQLTKLQTENSTKISRL